MYLSEEAIVHSLEAVRALGAQLAFTYFDRRLLDHPPLRERFTARVVARVGEPFRFGWVPAELPGWLARRGFHLERDESEADLLARLMPGGTPVRLPGRGHVAFARLRAGQRV